MNQEEELYFKVLSKQGRVFGLRVREHRTVQIIFNDVKVLYRFKEAGVKFFCG